MKKILLLLSVFTASLFVLWAQVPGGTMYVAVKKAAVRASTGFFAASRGTVELGSEVTVIQTRDKWIEIRSAAGGPSGWIAAAALTSKRISPSGYTLGTGEIAMAGKGFSGEVEQIYRQGETIDYSTVDAMESLIIPDEEIYAFLTEGRLERGE